MGCADTKQAASIEKTNIFVFVQINFFKVCLTVNSGLKLTVLIQTSNQDVKAADHNLKHHKGAAV